MDSWSHTLRALREKDGLTREQLGHIASVAPATIKAYELGHRNPSRHLLTAILSALKADMFTRAAVLEGAGFAPDGGTPSDRLPNAFFSYEEALAEVEASAFPACLSTEVLEVKHANAMLQKVWEVDLSRHLQGAFERSMLSMLSRSQVAERIANWDEAITLVISILKGHYGGEIALTAENPYFSAAFEHFLEGDSRYVQRFLELWNTTPARQRKLRFHYPITWRHSRYGNLRFLVQANPADEHGGLVFNDWIPLDAPTWDAVHTLAAEPAPARRP